MGTYSDPALILPESVGYDELKNAARQKFTVSPATEYTINWESGTDVYHSDDEEVELDAYHDGWYTWKTIHLDFCPSPVMQFAFSVKGVPSGGTWKIFVNDTPVGTSRSGPITEYTEYSEKLSNLENGNSVQLKYNGPFPGAASHYLKNYRILCTVGAIYNTGEGGGEE